MILILATIHIFEFIYQTILYQQTSMDTLYVIFLTFFTCSLAEIFVDYSDISNEGILLSKFFYGVQDGFFVDVGAYDPYFHSNTVNLEAMGWDGINVDAGPNRLVRFLYTKPFQNSLNAAIGLENEFSILYDLDDDSSSTVVKKVVDYNIQYNKKVMKQISVPSLSFKQFCQRYYLRRPLFMNLDIQGYGYKALESNDWTNPKCVPDIIISENNIVTQRSGFPQQDKLLIPNGYIKWKDRLGMNEAFIHSSVYDHYIKKYNEGNERFHKIQVVRFDTGIQIANKMKENVWFHYEINKDKFYYHVVRNDQIVDLQKINQYSNLISQNQKNRPILLMNYNPNKSFIALRRDYTYSLSQTPSMSNAFFNLTITMTNGGSFSVLIYDHQYGAKPRLLILQSEKRVAQKLTKQIENKDNKVYIDTNSFILLNTSIENLMNLNKKSSQQYKMTQKQISQFRKQEKYQNAILILEENQKQSRKSQLIILSLVLIAMIVVNLWICLLKLNSKNYKEIEETKQSQSSCQMDQFTQNDNQK